MPALRGTLPPRILKSGEGVFAIEVDFPYDILSVVAEGINEPPGSVWVALVEEDVGSRFSGDGDIRPTVSVKIGHLDLHPRTNPFAEIGDRESGKFPLF